MRSRHRRHRMSIARLWRLSTPKERAWGIVFVVAALAFSVAMFILKAKLIVWIGGA